MSQREFIRVTSRAVVVVVVVAVVVVAVAVV